MSKDVKTAAAAKVKEDSNVLRFARAHWEWVKKNDPAVVVSLCRAGRMALALRRVGIQCATELQRRTAGGEKAALVEAEINGAWIAPLRDQQPPAYHDPEGAEEAAADFEASEEGLPFAPVAKPKA